MVSRKVPFVSFIKFLKHARSIVKNPLPFHHENFERHGDTFQLMIGPKTHIFFSRNPNFLKYTLQKNQRNYTKSKIQTQDLKKYVGNGLLTNEGNSWKKQRKLIQPAFHKKQLSLLLETMKSVIISEVQQIPVDREVDIFPICNDLAFKVVAKSLFSSNIDAKGIAQLKESTEKAQQMLVKELRQPFLGWYFKYFGPIKKHLLLTQESREILLQLVQDRRECGVRYDDLLDMLLDARYDDGSEMGKEQLVDEILILFVAGHETTANALTFAFQLLAQHPEIQEKIREVSAFAKASLVNSRLSGEQTDTVNTDNLMAYLRANEYTKQVIEETLRLYPPAYFIDRVNFKADSFEGFEFEADSNLLFSVIEMHKHPDYWESPEQFKPSRFKDNAGMKHPAYFPFGAGPRMCIGNNFAMYEMMLAVIEVVEHYDIKSLSDDISIKPLITLKPKDAFLQFSKRS